MKKFGSLEMHKKMHPYSFGALENLSDGQLHPKQFQAICITSVIALQFNFSSNKAFKILIFHFSPDNAIELSRTAQFQLHFNKEFIMNEISLRVALVWQLSLLSNHEI